MFTDILIDNLYSSKRKKKRNQRQEDTQFMAKLLFNELYLKWKNIATSLFVWEGFDNTFISSQIEKLLFEQDNGCVMFVDSDGVEKVFPYNNKGGLNTYGLPVKISAIGLGGYNKNLTSYDNINDEVEKDSGVIIYNNKVKRSPRVYINLMVAKMVNIEQTIDVNINSIKTPFIANVDEDSVLTFKNLYKQISGNDPVVFSSRGQQIAKDMTLFQTGATFIGEQLNDMYNRYEGRILNNLGLQYIHNEKKERMVVAEVNKNDEYTNMNLASALDTRKEKAELLSKMLGKTITVDVNPLIKQMTNEEIVALGGNDNDSEE